MSAREHGSVPLEHERLPPLEPKQLKECVTLDPLSAQRLIYNSLKHVGPMASRMSCMVEDSEHLSEPLRRLGFQQVDTLENFVEEYCRPEEKCDESVDAVLFVHVGHMGSDRSALRKHLTAVSQQSSLPAVVAIALMPHASLFDAADEDWESHGPSTFDGSDRCSAEVMWQACERLGKVRWELLDAGADEVITAFGGEPIYAYQICEVAQNCEYMAAKVMHICDTESETMMRKAETRSKAAHQKFMMSLLEGGLDSIPLQDEQLDEWLDEEGNLCGVDTHMFTEVLGSGSSGTVFKARNPDEPEAGDVAVKVIPRAAIKNTSILMSLDREICILKGLGPHPNIVEGFCGYHGVWHVFLVMQHGGNCHLHRFIKRHAERNSQQTLPVDMISSIVAQQFSGLTFLHKALVAHRDLKPQNWIVQDNEGNLQLTDFGLAMQLNSPRQRLRKTCGSLPFCAPNVFSSSSTASAKTGYDPMAADIWSLGINFVELRSGLYCIERALGWMPDRPANPKDILKGLATLSVAWKKLEFTEVPGLSDVIDRMVRDAPHERYKAEQLQAMFMMQQGKTR